MTLSHHNRLLPKSRKNFIGGTLRIRHVNAHYNGDGSILWLGEQVLSVVIMDFHANKQPLKIADGLFA